MPVAAADAASLKGHDLDNRDSTAAAASLKRGFLLRTGILCAIAMIAVPLAALAGADAVSSLVGALSAIAATWLCVPMLVLACQGRFPLASPPSQPVLAVAIGAVVRVVFMPLALLTAHLLHGSVLVAGAFFLLLFAAFRTSEVVFVRQTASDQAAAAVQCGDEAGSVENTATSVAGEGMSALSASGEPPVQESNP